MMYIMESVNNLKIEVDTILQYFFWHGMQDDFKCQLIQITNKNKPKLTEINSNFFEACEKYKQLHKNPKDVKQKDTAFNQLYSEGSTTNLAVKVDYQSDKAKSFRSCSICSKLEGKDVNHAIHNCPKFLTASNKVDQLASMQGCTKCSNLTHSTKDCRYKFQSRCSRG